MKIKMNSLVITEYCSSDKRKYRFKKEISEDPLINHFISHNIDEWLENSEGLEKLLVGPVDIIAEQRKLVGFIRIASLDQDGTLNLYYGVHPDYRGNHYGTKILQEVQKCIFQKFPNAKKIELHIKEINSGSIRCAENAGFKLIRDEQLRKDDSKLKIYMKYK